MLQKITALLIVLLLAGCVSTGYQGITVARQDTALSETARQGTSFQVIAEHIPPFIGPIIVSNFSVALAERGLQPVSSGADLIATLRFESEDLVQQGSG